ncbi:hypothetical protein G6F68_015085 [Rhizopus microsporus]|nr:hypothetical protein G6F68_015085 [Rhizopus microsporus]
MRLTASAHLPWWALLHSLAAHLDQATGAEQARRIEAGVKLVPVEIAAIGVEHLALADPGTARTRADGVGRLQHAQRLRAGNQIDRRQCNISALAGQLLRTQFHLRCSVLGCGNRLGRHRAVDGLGLRCRQAAPLLKLGADHAVDAADD